MPRESTVRIVRELADRGYNADREAVTLLAGAANPSRAIERAVETAPDDALVLSAGHVREALDKPSLSPDQTADPTDSPQPDRSPDAPNDDPSISTGNGTAKSQDDGAGSPVETKGSQRAAGTNASTETAAGDSPDRAVRAGSPSAGKQVIEVSGDISSRGTGEYGDFIDVFRDRYETLAGKLRGRVNHRPTDAVASMPGGSDAAIIGMMSDIRSTASGHWLIELEDTNGTFPCLVMKDREFASAVPTMLHDEVVAVEGTLSDDNDDGDGILFVDALHFPDVPRTHSPSTADREVSAALISDIHVGSQEFRADAWERFAGWLHTEEAAEVEYLLIAGDMVEGVGVYPDQDEELDIVDIYDQYERFAELLKQVPGEIEIAMIPGNHDAVRLAEPQPAFDEELREIMSAHDARISANPSTVTLEGVSVLMYHGVSLDELIAELPEDAASYERPHDAMAQLLKKRHVAPQYGGGTRIAPEPEDHLVIEEVPDVFHTGHVHKLGYGTYHNVLTINSSCWQSQTAFQKSVNLDPDVAYAPIVDLSALELTIR
ncbi:DNA polymerase II [Halobacteriales archaeon SW_7_65_23]|nr:MAG: DNA polymerase II [Halobacteriales archaeon SW_7_65_23]